MFVMKMLKHLFFRGDHGIKKFVHYAIIHLAFRLCFLHVQSNLTIYKCFLSTCLQMELNFFLSGKKLTLDTFRKLSSQDTKILFQKKKKKKK